jgi:GNAT superfamily N-acetyltransferase
MDLRPLDASTAAAFRTLMERSGDECRSCLCTVYHVPSWENHSLAGPCRERLIAEGPCDGFLLYEGGAAVGWCQAAPRERFALMDRHAGAGGRPGDWAVTCLVLAPEARRKGRAHDLLRLVLEEARRRGARRVQAVACRYGPDEDTSASIEFPESLCRRAGMTLERDHPMRPVYVLDIGEGAR